MYSAEVRVVTVVGTGYLKATTFLLSHKFIFEIVESNIDVEALGTCHYGDFSSCQLSSSAYRTYVDDNGDQVFSFDYSDNGFDVKIATFDASGLLQIHYSWYKNQGIASLSISLRSQTPCSGMNTGIISFSFCLRRLR